MVSSNLQRYVPSARLLTLGLLACFCAIVLAQPAQGKTKNVEKLIAQLGDIRHGISAEHELIRIGSPAVEPLIAAMQDPNPHVRTHAAYALGEIRDLRALKPLVAALQDTTPFVKNAADSALRKIILQPQAVEPLIGYLKDPDVQVRYAAAFALSEIKDPKTVEPLIGALQDTDARVRDYAVYGLAEISNTSAVEPLIATLKDGNATVRRHSADALGQMKDSRAVEPLIAALKDVDANVRQHAADALGQIKDSQAVEPLIALLTDTDAQVRGSAANALGAIKDPRALDSLVAAAKDPDTSVRNSVASSLHRIRVELPDGRFIPNHDGTVLDTKTNLMWAAKDNGADIEWQNARAYCVLFRAGGYTDWRMPYGDELAGLYDASKTQPWPGRPDQNAIHFATEVIELTSGDLLAAVRPKPGLIGVVGVPIFAFQTGEETSVFGCGPYCGRVLPVRSTVAVPASAPTQTSTPSSPSSQ